MSILNYLPKFKVLEVNRLTGLIAGHVLAQFPASSDIATKTVGDVNFIENGIIVGLNEDLEIDNYDATEHAQPFLVFNEELNTFVDGLKYYAQEVKEYGAYPRAIGLYIGDVFTTDNMVIGVGATDYKYAKVDGGLLTLVENREDGIFAVEKSTLPDGTDARRFIYIGAVEVTE